MKIIQHGSKEKIETISAKKIFSCACCGCLFEATINEYIGPHSKYGIAHCTCPDCGNNAFEKEGDSP